MITRIGCYLFGCDFGEPLQKTAPAWLAKLGTFPRWDPTLIVTAGGGPGGSPAFLQHLKKHLVTEDAVSSLPVHPTQIYESLIGAALLGIVFLQRKHQRFRGQVFMTFAFAYGLFRFLVEIVRDDAERGLYGPQLAAHILIPGALFAFALGYVLSFSNAVENVQLRRLTQVISFIPAVVAYLMLRPASFADAQLTQLSTSQWVGLLTAVAVSVGFALFWKVAEAHPEQAMAIDLSGFQEVEAARNRKGPAPVESKAEEEQQEEDDEDQPKKPVKAAGRADGAAKVVDAKFDDQPAKDEAKGETKAEAKSDEKPSDEAKSEQA
jgi:phosphatidylglycerol:prolipoprotein diacylglycerol transferase